MRVRRVGVTPVKGMAHTATECLALLGDGPRHDCVFCLIDTDTGQVVRTVNNTGLMACRAWWDPPELTISTPIGQVRGEVRDGPVRTADYWGRMVRLSEVEGEWSDLISRYRGRPTRLCRVHEPGGVVYAGAVSLVTTSSLDELAQRLGRGSDDGRRFRATCVVETAGAPPFVEDTWIGSTVRLGLAVVRVSSRVPRCAVVNGCADTGERDADVLKALAADRTIEGEIAFGVDAEIVLPGTVASGDRVELVDPAVGSGS